MIWLVSVGSLLIAGYTLYRITMIGAEVEGLIADVSVALDEINRALLDLGVDDEDDDP